MARTLVRDFGSSLRFNSSNSDRVTFKTSKLIADRANSTVALWFKTQKIPADATHTSTLYCGRAATGNNIFKWDIHNNKRMRMVHRNDGGTLDNPNGPSAGAEVCDGMWHFAAFTKSSLNVIFYLDGAQDHTQTLTGGDTLTNANINVRVGGDAADANVFYHGLIDEVWIFDRTLSATEIADLYARGTLDNLSNLLGRYKFDEGSGTAAVDSAGVQADGTITGATYSTDIPGDLRLTAP